MRMNSKYLIVSSSVTVALACSSEDDGRGSASGGSGITDGNETAGDSGLDGGNDKLDLGNNDTDNATAEGGPGNCHEYDIMVDVVPPNVLLVLDYSLTMQQSFSGDTRWAGLWDAVEYLTDNYDALINLGAMTFPDVSAPGQNSCVTAEVEVPVAPMNGATIMSTIPARATQPPGNTPTQYGMTVGAAHLETLDPMIDRAIILITDGEPLCKPGQANVETPDDTVAPFIATLFQDRGIPTYVLGMALNSSAEQVLNDMAIAGGRPNPAGPQQYYAANDPAQLQSAFDTIGDQVISCIIDLDQKPGDPKYFEVHVGGMVWDQVMDCASEDGWVFVPGSMDKQIELCGQTCAKFKQTGMLKTVQSCPPTG